MESLPAQCYDEKSDRWFVNGKKKYTTRNDRFCCKKTQSKRFKSVKTNKKKKKYKKICDCLIFKQLWK